MKTCTIEGCNKRHKAHGMCRTHYVRYRAGTQQMPEQPEKPAGMRIEFPYDVLKIDGDWHRRLDGTDDPWVPVVWEDKWEQVS